MDFEKLFADLESNNLQQYEESRQKLTEMFMYSKDPWLVQGMMDYYLKTNSNRVLEVLVKVQQPHDNYVFDRLSEWMKNQNRLAAITLFGFIIRKHPTWLHKVAKHRLMKDILRLLQTEREIVPLMSALLCIVTLLPIIPSSTNIIPDLFEVFGHLAYWNLQNPNRLNQYQIIHLQLGLHMLFHRLYGMYPFNFINYLKELHNKDKSAIFNHTILPLLETVRIHPFLITGTKENETNIARWRDMEPHDVVVDCAKLSLAYNSDSNFENYLSSSLNNTFLTSTTTTTTHLYQSSASLQNTPFDPFKQLDSSPFNSIMHPRENLTHDFSKFSNYIWSPHLEILSTPPPTGTIPCTPTPLYVVPSVSTSTDLSLTTNSLLNVSGSSPPEAAVEATPETTPMKDISIRRPLNKSQAVRTIIPTSQPTSPMRKEQSPFYFPPTNLEQSASGNTNFKYTMTTFGSNSSSQKVMNIINDRSVSNTIGNSGRFNLTSGKAFQNSIASATGVMGRTFSTNQSLDSPSFSTDLDIEVTTLTSQPGLCSSSGVDIEGGPRHSDTLQDISNECGDCDEIEQSNQSLRSINVPTNKPKLFFDKCYNTEAQFSNYNNKIKSCYLSYGTIPNAKNVSLANENSSYVTVVANAKLRRTNSWPAIDLSSLKDDETSFSTTDQDISIHNDGTRQNGLNQNNLVKEGNDSSSPSGDDVMSASTHFKQVQQKRDKKNERNLFTNKKFISQFSGSYNAIKKDKGTSLITPKISNSTQTIEQWPQFYQYSLFDVMKEETQIRKAVNPQNIVQPREILDKFVDLVIKTKNPNEQRTKDEEYKEQIQLLYLQLQYAEYRREIHAERNRRLMGRCRDKKNLELENKRLRDQLRNLEKENKTLILDSMEIRRKFNEKEEHYTREISILKGKYEKENDEKTQWKSKYDEIQKKACEDMITLEKYKSEVEGLKGDLHDTNLELENTRKEAEKASEYKENLVKLEREFIAMGEIQVRCKEKFEELENLKECSEEMRQLQEVCKAEIHELRSVLDEKLPQLESAKHRVADLNQQLLNKEISFTDQKRLLKTVKDEYEEKFKALNKKYESQKSIMIQMEQKIFELYAKRTLSAILSPESERIDIASSVDRTSPLSTSLASSEGLSASLRSVSEFCNIQSLNSGTVKSSTTTGFTSTQTVTVTNFNVSSPQKFASNSGFSGSSVATAVSASSSLMSNDDLMNPKANLILTSPTSSSSHVNNSLSSSITTLTAAAAAATSSGSSSNYYQNSGNSSNSSNIPVPGNQHHRSQYQKQYSTHNR